MYYGYINETTEDTKKRFHQSYTIVDDCWIWNKPLSKSGYGSFSMNGQGGLAHRASLILHGILIPEGHIVRHFCPKKHRNCVNPEHLTTGTHKQNMEDMIRDGSSTFGEKNPAVKLTETQVLEIRRESSNNILTDLAKKYSVSSSSIWSIVKRKTWKHI
jgi:hypothetical protein